MVLRDISREKYGCEKLRGKSAIFGFNFTKFEVFSVKFTPFLLYIALPDEFH